MAGRPSSAPLIKIADYDYFASTVGNAFFSGVSFNQLWDCITLSTTREQFDAAVEATITLNQITNGE